MTDALGKHQQNFDEENFEEEGIENFYIDQGHKCRQGDDIEAKVQEFVHNKEELGSSFKSQTSTFCTQVGTHFKDSPSTRSITDLHMSLGERGWLKWEIVMSMAKIRLT